MFNNQTLNKMLERKTKLAPRNYNVTIVVVSKLGEDYSEKIEVVEIPSQKLFDGLFEGMEIHTLHLLGTRSTQ